tara:strand:+ start:80 stop:1009 length:930 start_codon:yes stop_codon:yes gene_type:complete
MAKKIKQKKSGMIRRQQKKRHQKKIRRRSSMSSRNQNNHESSEKIEQLLSTLPTLAFEPELTDLKMNESELMDLLDKSLTETEIFSKLLTDSFISEFKSRLTQIVESNSEKSIKSILAQATQHQLENGEKSLYVSNPLLIAIFLKNKAATEGKEFELKDLTNEIKKFNERNEKALRNFTENLPDNEIANLNEESNEQFDGDIPSKKLLPVIEPSIYKKFLENLPHYKKQRIEDDLEVFLEDFQPPALEKWDNDLVKSFLEKWFIGNANPMKDDLESMHESLMYLFQFMNEENLLSKDFFNEVSHYLKKE